jgi:hypothetical protein
MPRIKQASKRKHLKKAAPVVGAVGVSLSLAGGASAAVAPATDTSLRATAPTHEIILNEEEISDVSLGTFYVFDKETRQPGQQYAQRGCRGCGGCRGCARGCRSCRACGGCGGCSCGCCISWGACRFLC